MPPLRKELFEANGLSFNRATTVLDGLGSAGVEVEFDDTADFENGWEELLRLHAAVSIFKPEKTWLNDLTTDAAPRPLGGQQASAADLAQAATYGPLPSSIHTGHPVEHMDIAYWQYETFLRNAGRKVATAGFSPDDKNALDALTAAQTLADAQGRVFVKPTHSKILPATTMTKVDRGFGETLDFEHMAWEWAPVQHEGKADFILAQQFVEMRYEYRFFVVDGQIVTGAGCIEEHTPFDGLMGRPFDARVREHRKELSATEDRPELVSELRKFATRITAEFAAEGLEQNYTLDVAIGPDERPLIIELNGIDVAGFYASSPYLVAHAIRRQL